MRIQSLKDLHYQFPDADGYWTTGSLLTSEDLLRRDIATFKESQQEARLTALIQLVRNLDLQERAQEAGGLISQIKQMCLSSKDIFSPRVQIRLLIEEGRHRSLAMVPNKARNHFLNAWELACKKGEFFFAIEAAVLLSICLPPRFQNQWLEQALRIAGTEKKSGVELWLAHLYSMEGWRQFDLRQFEEALNSFQKAVDLPRKKEERIDPLRLKWSVARTVRALGRVDEALNLQTGIQAELEKSGKCNGHVFLEVAECLQLLKKRQESKIYFEMAHKELSKDPWYRDNKASELTRMLELSKKR